MDNGDGALVSILLIVISLVVIGVTSLNGCEDGNARMISRTERVIKARSLFGFGPQTYMIQIMACEPYDGCNWETYFESPDPAEIEHVLSIGKDKK